MDEPAPSVAEGPANPLARWAATLPPPPFVNADRRPGRVAVRAALPARRRPHRRGGRRRTRAVDGPRQHPAVHPRPAVRLPARSAGPLARPSRPAADARDPRRLRRRDRPVHRIPGADAHPARQRDHPLRRRLPEARREPRPPAPASRRVLRAPPDPDRGPRVDRQPDRRVRPGRRRRAVAAAPTCRSCCRSSPAPAASSARSSPTSSCRSGSPTSSRTRRRWSRRSTGRSPQAWRFDTWAVIKTVERDFGQWVRGQILLGFAVGIATFVGLIVLSNLVDPIFGRYALLLSVIAGLFELVPIIGPIISAVPAVLLAATVGPVAVLAALLLYFLVQQVENNFLVPEDPGRRGPAPSGGGRLRDHHRRVAGRVCSARSWRCRSRRPSGTSRATCSAASPRTSPRRSRSRSRTSAWDPDDA